MPYKMDQSPELFAVTTDSMHFQVVISIIKLHVLKAITLLKFLDMVYRTALNIGQSGTVGELGGEMVETSKY